MRFRAFNDLFQPARLFYSRIAGLARPLAWIAIGLSLASGLSQSIEYETMPGLIERGTDAFSKGDYIQASQAFEKLQATYSQEQEWTDARLNETLIPLAGYAALRAGLYNQAIDSLELYIHEGGSSYSQDVFVAYTLALALKRKGEFKEAFEAFEQFRSTSLSPSQQGISRIHDTEILQEMNQPNQAAESLNHVFENADMAARVRAQARLRLIQLHLFERGFQSLPRIPLAIRYDA